MKKSLVPRINYKDSPVGSSFFNHVSLEEGQVEDYIDEDEEGEEEGEQDCSLIQLSTKEKRRIREPWRSCLITKVIGRQVSRVYFSSKKAPDALEGARRFSVS
jgi:hypothetical protein